MSNRINYFKKIRPELAEDQFSLQQQAKMHLEAKTAALIQVAVKAQAGNAEGVVRFAKQALKLGADPQEVIDAVTVTLPEAGITRVLEALDALSGLSGFSEEELAPKAKGFDLGPFAEIPQGYSRRMVAGEGFLLWREGDSLKVYDHHCPHQLVPIEAQPLGSKLTCPLHKWSFDLQTGGCLGPGHQDLTSWIVEILDGVVHCTK